MSLDARIKEMANTQVDMIVEEAYKAVEKVVSGTACKTHDIARLVSGHKTKSTRDAAVKAVAEQLGEAMLKSMIEENSA